MNVSPLVLFCEQHNITFSISENMSLHTTFKIGGKADIFITVNDEEELLKVISFCSDKKLPYFIIGNGSNLLVSDEGIDGAVISLKGMKGISLVSEDEIICEAGVPLSALCMFAYNNGLSGLEFAYGIPGSVGGAVFMNAGAYGGEIKDVLVSARAYKKTFRDYCADDLELGYRTSVFKHNGAVITSCKFKLNKANSVEIKAKMDENMKKRTDKQPLEYPSAGSTFKRPEGYFAAALIDRNNLRGKSVGDAQVSTKHAGFVINKGNATAKDVLSLMKIITDTVYEKENVKLCPEVIFVGR